MVIIRIVIMVWRDDYMDNIIDFDLPEKFPYELNDLGYEFEKRLYSSINMREIEEWWQVEHKLRNMYIDDMPLVTDYIKHNSDKEIACYHCTRILDIRKYWDEGIITGGGKGSTAEKRLRELFSSIGLNNNEIDDIFSHIYYYWNRDGGSRTNAVHFFLDKKHIYNDDKANIFAINLGGEIVRWSLESIDRELFKREPYKRLWILGTPSIIKFKCKLCNIPETSQRDIIAEIIKYNIVSKIYNFPNKYVSEVTAMTIGNVPPQDIISIEEITNYISIQEKYFDFEGFYTELK